MFFSMFCFDSGYMLFFLPRFAALLPSKLVDVSLRGRFSERIALDKYTLQTMHHLRPIVLYVCWKLKEK